MQMPAATGRTPPDARGAFSSAEPGRTTTGTSLVPLACPTYSRDYNCLSALRMIGVCGGPDDLDSATCFDAQDFELATGDGAVREFGPSALPHLRVEFARSLSHRVDE